MLRGFVKTETKTKQKCIGYVIANNRDSSIKGHVISGWFYVKPKGMNWTVHISIAFQ